MGAQKNGGVLTPPVGQCSICTRMLGTHVQRAKVTVDTFVGNELDGPAIELHACCETHLAEALERYAAAIRRGQAPKFGRDPVTMAAAGVNVAKADEWDW